MSMTLSLAVRDEAATERLAAGLAPHLAAGWRLYLSGELGAGKTHFTRALLRALGHRGRVRSPTFTLLEPYEFNNFTLYHFDFYRFSDNNDWRDAGFDEWLSDPRAITVIEWSEMAGNQLPVPDVHLRFEFAADGSRKLHLQSHSARGDDWLKTISQDTARDGVPAAPPPDGTAR